MAHRHLKEINNSTNYFSKLNIKSIVALETSLISCVMGLRFYTVLCYVAWIKNRQDYIEDTQTNLILFMCGLLFQ